MPAVTVRVDHPRRTYPTVRVFVDAVLLSESDAHRDDAPAIAEHLRSHADAIASAAYPAAAIRRLTAEAV